jgi:hypothetical protein
MTLREIWVQTSKWLGISRFLKSYRGWLSNPAAPRPQIDADGLIFQNDNSTAPAQQDVQQLNAERCSPNTESALATNPAGSIEKLQNSFERLLEQLAEINQHLNHQAAAHEELIGRIEQLPKILEGFPSLVENQKQITEQLFEQLKSTTVRTEQFVDAVEKIPTETAKQTDALAGIEHQLAAAADIDVQMAESLNGFNQALEKLNQKTLSQTESIDQMSKTFATSDRYLKYIMSQQSRRFTWIFIAAVGVCAAVILILTGIIIYLK